MSHTLQTGHPAAADKPRPKNFPATPGCLRRSGSPPGEVPRAVLLVAVLLAGCGLAAPSQAGTTGGARNVTVAVGPDDGPGPVLETIRAARRRILLEMYMLTSPDAVAALVAARDAGVDVRVLLEPAPFAVPEANLPAFAALAAAGVDVRWVARPTGLCHTKLLIADDRTAIIMSLNLTVAGLGLNREFAIADADPTDVRWAQALWNADAIGADPGTPPATTRLITSPIDARSRLTAAIESARVSIAVEMEELSDPNLVQRLAAAHTRGVAVTVVAPASDTSAATAAALRGLAAAGVTVRVLPAPTIHAKAMVIDQRTVYVGSVNFTRASLDDNREVGILLDTPAAIARVSATIAADAARGRPP
jgi:cardiolipin synthase